MAKATEEIFKYFQNIMDIGHFNQSSKYCAICLRTERKLTESKAFVLCTKKIKVRTPSNNHLCYVCEAQVSAAWRTIRSITLAAAVNGWYHAHAHRISTHMSHLQKATLFNVIKSLQLDDDDSMDSQWSLIRKHSTLAQTEALLISTDCPPLQTNYTMQSQPTEIHGHIHNSSYSGPPDTENIVTIADDEPASLTAIEKLLPADGDALRNAVILPSGGSQQMMIRDPNKANSFVIYPMLRGVDGNMYVPYLNTKVTADSLHYIPEGQVTKNTPKSDLNFEQEVSDDLMNYSGGTVKVKVIEEQEPKEKVISGHGDSGNSVENRDCVKHAVMSDKVDWEDKIPMDVISFVDATDPNAQQFLTPEPALDPIAIDEMHIKPKRNRSITDKPTLAIEKPAVIIEKPAKTQNESDVRPATITQMSDENGLLLPVRNRRMARKTYYRSRISDAKESDVIIDLC